MPSVVWLYVLVVVLAFLNPIVTFRNRDGRLRRLALFLGMLQAFGIGFLSFVTYQNSQAVKALAIIGAMHGAGGL
ncbi:hypothetical protein [Bradyrhizobium sp. SZCCHNR1015]|uniref:hypothetical protein n=1 Tax=Bradyrhizobium sp. SZCCHNR1015 TaxID=3057338 RepID=UPI00291655C7|nr:hypothetical protein [Bradyrhizobium sp. SZCCHNR1015]